MIATLATVPAIVALVNLAKRLGLPTKGALALAFVLGIALNVASGAWAETAWWGWVSDGALMGLGAAGLYDLVPSRAKVEVTTPAPEVSVVVPEMAAIDIPNPAGLVDYLNGLHGPDPSLYPDSDDVVKVEGWDRPAEDIAAELDDEVSPEAEVDDVPVAEGAEPIVAADEEDYDG